MSAAFAAASSQILGFLTVGGTTYALNGLYGGRTLQSIYSHGIDALVCVENSISPLQQPYAVAQELQKDASALEEAIKSFNEDDRKKYAVQIRNAEATRLKTEETKRSLMMQINSAGIAKAENAVRTIISAVNAQIESATPDAAAFARAGSSIGGVSAAPIQTTGNANSLADAMSRLFAEERITIENATPAPSVQEDPVLKQLQTQANDDIDHAAKYLTVDGIKAQDVPCQVADLAPLSPIAISAGTTITYSSADRTTYFITGGTGHYSGPYWNGKSPDSSILNVYIKIPDTLVLETVKGATLPTDKYTFDIQDSLGNHLPQLVTLNVSPPAPVILSVADSPLSVKVGTSKDTQISGGAPQYKTEWTGDKKPSTNVTATATDSKLTINVPTGTATGEYTLEITDNNGVKLDPPLEVHIVAP